MSLEAILRSTHLRIARLKAEVPKALTPSLPHDFIACLADRRPAVIAEVKLASPSLGPIAPLADPIKVAGEYLEAGAAALSVLTEPDFFKGSIDHLRAIRRAFPEAAILRKDFILDESQLFETRHAGADACLLIVALLEQTRLEYLFGRAVELGLTPLVEVHDEKEMERARALGAPLIGVNSRNLATLDVDLTICRRLDPAGAFVIAESGIDSGKAIAELSELGYRGFLVGSALMKSPGANLRRLLGEAREGR